MRRSLLSILHGLGLDRGPFLVSICLNMNDTREHLGIKNNKAAWTTTSYGPNCKFSLLDSWLRRRFSCFSGWIGTVRQLRLRINCCTQESVLLLGLRAKGKATKRLRGPLIAWTRMFRIETYCFDAVRWPQNGPSRSVNRSRVLCSSKEQDVFRCLLR